MKISAPMSVIPALMIALGVFVIAINFIVEAVVADHLNPNPYSPAIWAVVSLVAGVALAACIRFALAARPR